mmetsp:Transcript_132402/g.229628  ORF Transcript_132402/g.229628 Transcript_132402/m.229628 type:complete len:150 (-) Transcript_132402:340-789(-)
MVILIFTSPPCIVLSHAHHLKRPPSLSPTWALTLSPPLAFASPVPWPVPALSLPTVLLVPWWAPPAPILRSLCPVARSFLSIPTATSHSVALFASLPSSLSEACSVPVAPSVPLILKIRGTVCIMGLQPLFVRSGVWRPMPLPRVNPPS